MFENSIMGFHISIDNTGSFSPAPTLFLIKKITMSTVCKSTDNYVADDEEERRVTFEEGVR